MFSNSIAFIALLLLLIAASAAPALGDSSDSTCNDVSGKSCDVDTSALNPSSTLSTTSTDAAFATSAAGEVVDGSSAKIASSSPLQLSKTTSSSTPSEPTGPVDGNIDNSAANADDSVPLIQRIKRWCKDHMTTIAIIVYVIVKLKLSRRPIVELEGSKVIDIRNGFHFDEVFEKAKAENSRVICNFYCVSDACRFAATLFSNLSKKYAGNRVIFIKVNSDICKDLVLRNKIKRYPTFIFFGSDAKAIQVVSEAPEWPQFEEFCRTSGTFESPPTSSVSSNTKDESKSD